MLYNSLEFAGFLGIVAGLYHLCPAAWRRWYLLIASYAFYCTWSVPFAFLLLTVTGVAYVVARRIDGVSNDSGRRAWLTAGLVLLLLPLVTLKYSGWLGGASISGIGGASWLPSLPATRLLVPVGISYYTLKVVSYLVDVYLEHVQPCRRFSTLATYAAFFPQILAGPIQRAGDFLGQVEQAQGTRAGMIGSGVQLMLFGLFKKLVLADRLGLIVDQVFARPDSFSGPVLVAASYLFVIQLYADFSGLTDIALGAGRLFGFEGPQNFDAPFFAQTIPEFWRRWHMTLTSWVTDYVFMPLRIMLRGLGRGGLVISLMANMIAVGIWHGASLNFVIFGFIHGCYISISVLTMQLRQRLYQRPVWNRIHVVTGPIVTFHLIVAAAIVFRVNSLQDAWYIFERVGAMLVSAVGHFGGGVTAAVVPGALQLKWRVEDTCIAAAAAVLMETVHVLRRSGRSPGAVLAMPTWVRLGACYALGVAILLWGQSESKQFIYAQF